MIRLIRTGEHGRLRVSLDPARNDRPAFVVLTDGVSHRPGSFRPQGAVRVPVALLRDLSAILNALADEAEQPHEGETR